MTTPHRTLQMALDALDAITDDVDGTGLNTMPSFDKALDAIAALREALNAPEPEPVAWKCANCGNTSDCQGVGQGDNWCNSCAVCGEMKPLYAAPPAAPADDHATPSGGQEAGPQEDRIEAAYWRFDARHKGYSQWKTAPMSERDAFKAEMRNALEAEKVRAEMRLVARGWRRPDAPAAPAPAAPVPDGWVMVPREPTEDMIQAAAGAWGESEGGLHNAFAAALRGGITASPAAHVVPLTDEQIRSMWKSSEFRGNGGQVDWFCEGIRAAEAHHGITGGSK